MTQQMWQANTEPVSGARCVATQHTPQGAVSPALRHVAMQHTPQHTASVAVSIPHIQQHIALGKNQHTQQPPAPVSMQASPPPPPSSNRIHNVSTDKERSVHPTNARYDYVLILGIAGSLHQKSRKRKAFLFLYQVACNDLVGSSTIVYP